MIFFINFVYICIWFVLRLNPKLYVTSTQMHLQLHRLLWIDMKQPTYPYVFIRQCSTVIYCLPEDADITRSTFIYFTDSTHACLSTNTTDTKHYKVMHLIGKYYMFTDLLQRAYLFESLFLSPKLELIWSKVDLDFAN